ncbi:uncharacterized protein LOC119608888 [Lucilia sericata]|uniref:uncharacterized protein LOC119608888 n=1 Tax=Lucilia sericata TaxID=13632 RepID=UPI0018A8160B|nr:uncharacterized protein LOC119608888 [Lucilia sericata]
MSKFLVIFLIVLVLGFSASLPQIEHGSLNGPSGRFERTKNQAAPPVDLSLPPIFLPESIPIHEDVKEFHGSY